MLRFNQFTSAARQFSSITRRKDELVLRYTQTSIEVRHEPAQQPKEASKQLNNRKVQVLPRPDTCDYCGRIRNRLSGC